MTEKSSIEQAIDAAPPGLIMAGTVEVHKVMHTDKHGVTTAHTVMIGKIGDTEFRKELHPAVLRALAGKGPMGKVLGKFFGGPELGQGPAGG